MRSVPRPAQVVWRIAVLLLIGLAYPAAAAADETVMVCDVYGNHVAARPQAAHGIWTSNRCPGNAAVAGYTRGHPPGGMTIWTVAHRSVKQGETVRWKVASPRGLVITAVDIPHMYSSGLNDSSGWRGGLFWSGGTGGVHTVDRQSSWSSANNGGTPSRWPSSGTHDFGWRVGCHASRCAKTGDQWLSIELLELRVHETVGPRLRAPDGIWQADGWIRGWWALHFSGDSPSGLCAMAASINGQAGPGVVSERNRSVWHQCAAPAVNQAVDTAQYGQGAMPLTLTAVDSAGMPVTYTKTIEVDNQRPTISLTGPTEAASTAGTQYVHATATAGPSGVAGISCSLDGAPARWYPLPAADISVHGAGMHHLSCYSQNNARDSRGIRATSPSADWTLRIQSPSVSTVSFVRVAGALRCTGRFEKVRIPAHWVTAYHHGHRVRVRVRARTRRVRVVHCHPRVVYRRVHRDGRWIRRRIVVLPHRVSVSQLRVAFGKSARVSGWLGTSGGEALGRKRVHIMVAPANGSRHFKQVAVVRTSPNGSWRTSLRPGPSRIVVARYDGGATVEPSISKPAHLVVSAALRLHIQPHSVRWGGTIRISGRVRGGYIPPGGEIVFLWIRWKSGSSYVGHLYTAPDGAFRSTYTFFHGNGTVAYRLSATTGRENDYPYAPGRSNRVRVTVAP